MRTPRAISIANEPSVSEPAAAGCGRTNSGSPVVTGKDCALLTYHMNYPMRLRHKPGIVGAAADDGR